MGENMKCEQIGLIGELMQGKELAKQLCDHIFSPSPPSSSSFNVTNEVLIEKILSSYEQALTMLNSGANAEQTKMDFQCSNGSPKSEVEDSYFRHNDVSKKRKTMTRRTEHIKVYSGTSLEGSLNDGYSWRKYGQKDILGAKFPRGYYRCTHRNAQGCLATKQVQKSDEDPMIYEITYKGRHTCTQATHLNKACPSKTKLALGENKPQTHQKNQPQAQKVQPAQEIKLSFGSGPEIKIEDLDNLDNKEDIFPSFNFASPSIGSENEDNDIFSKTMVENNFMETFSPSAFLSPTTSESNFFCLSPCHFDSIGLGPNVQTSESDITEIVSDPSSVPNSPVDLDIFFNDMDFDMVFPIYTPEHSY